MYASPLFLLFYFWFLKMSTSSFNSFFEQDRQHTLNEEMVQGSELVKLKTNVKIIHCGIVCNQHRQCLSFSYNDEDSGCMLYFQKLINQATILKEGEILYRKLDAMCDNPSKIPNGRVLNDEGKMKRNVIDFVCDMFYKPSTQKGTCFNDGTWLGLEGLCVATEMQTPLIVPVGGKITVGSVIVVQGTPTTRGRFNVILKDSSSRALLHIAVRLNDKAVVRNSRLESWEHEERGLSASFPFKKNKMFTMTVHVKSDQYKCNVDGRKLFTFKHRYPPDNVVRVFIVQSVRIKSVTFSHY